MSYKRMWEEELEGDIASTYEVDDGEGIRGAVVVCVIGGSMGMFVVDDGGCIGIVCLRGDGLYACGEGSSGYGTMIGE